MNLLPILTGQIKARACDWAVEGKGGAGSLRGERGRRKRDRERKMEEEEVEDGAEPPRGPEEPQVARDLISGGLSSAVEYLLLLPGAP